MRVAVLLASLLGLVAVRDVASDEEGKPASPELVDSIENYAVAKTREERFIAAAADLNRRVEALEYLTEASEARQQSGLCMRGMGDDVTKSYPPYLVISDETSGKEILCDTHTDGGGWLVIQRRAAGNVDFYKNWAAYREGFGSPTTDFWLGNEAIYNLTNQASFEVRIDLRINGDKFFAYSTSFKVESEKNLYRLRLGRTSGNIGSSGLSHHNNAPFTTFDRDNDAKSTSNCAVEYHGAWWYKACYHSNPNGTFGKKNLQGIAWFNGKAWLYPSFIEIKIRQV